jgi:kynureninase
MQSKRPDAGPQNRQNLPTLGAKLRDHETAAVADLRSRSHAERLDAPVELARYRAEFYLPPGQIYLDGNSLGLLSRRAEATIGRAIEQWKKLGIEGWTSGDEPWFFLAEELAKQTAPLLGAAPDEIIVANSTTVNLHQLLATLFHPHGARTKLLTDALAFPSDTYAMQSQLALRGLDPATHLVRVPSRGGFTIGEDDVIAAMTDDVHTAVLPAVIYTSGQILDMPRLTRAARERDIVIGWDLCHSIGAIEHDLDAWDADFAFWCSYKYLNAGPGAVGGLYLNRRHFGTLPGLAGWFSSDKRKQFDMSPTLTPAPGTGAMQNGTPHVLSMAALRGSLELLHEAGLPRLRERSLRLTRYLMDLSREHLAPLGVAIATPAEDHRRGGHVALIHPDAARICKALRAAGVVPDHRPPNVIRLAPVALYNTFAECFDAVTRLREIVQSRSYEAVDAGRELVP